MSKVGSTMRPLEVGRVYRVTISWGYGPKGKRRTLNRYIGRLVELDEHYAEFRTNKRETHITPLSMIVDLRYIEEG